MADGVRSVAIRFIGDTKGLDQAAQDGEKNLGKWEKGFQKLDKVATGVLIGIGGAIAGAVTQTVRSANEIADTAPKLGVSTEAYQEMSYWAEQNGLSQAQMEKAVGRLNQRMGLAAEGNEKYADGFEDLGVKIQNAQGDMRDTEDVMADTIQSLSEIEDPQERAAKASEVLGTSMARDLMPALEDGSLSLEEAEEKAHDLGLVMDDEALQASQNFQDTLNELKAVGQGLLQDFAIPFLNWIGDELVPVIQEQVIPAVRNMGQWFRDNQGPLLAITGAVAGLAVVIKLVTLATKAWQAIMIVVRGVTVAWTAVQWLLNAAFWANPITWVIGIIVALIAIFVLAWKNSETFRNIVTGAWEGIKSAASAVGSWFTDTLWPWIKDVWDNIKSGAQGMWNRVKEIWNSLKDAATDAAGWVEDKFTAVVDFFRDMPGKIKNATSNLWDGIKDAFRSAINWLIDRWNGLTFEIPSVDVPGVGEVGGATISTPNIPRLASGGPARAGRSYLVGEEGPELFTPNRSGEVTPNDELGAGVIENHIHIGDEVVCVVRTQIREGNRGVRRSAAAGAGGAR